jgi:putative ABC transport system permease protein
VPTRRQYLRSTIPVMLRQNIRQALSSIRANRLRSVLTALIIAFGITAIVGVLTSIDSIQYWMRSSFSTLGANTFMINSEISPLKIGGRRERTVYRPISYAEALQFRAQFGQQNLVSLRGEYAQAATGRSGGRTTEANLQVRGTDQHFLTVESFKLELGRPISEDDVQQQRRVCLIGHKVRTELFPSMNPLGRGLFIGHQKFEVIGVLEEKGTAFGSPGDRLVTIPVTTGMSIYGGNVSQHSQRGRGREVELRHRRQRQFRIHADGKPGIAHHFSHDHRAHHAVRGQHRADEHHAG